MGSFSVTIAQQAYLERQAGILSERLKRKVAPKEVLHAVLNLAIQDEGIYDVESPFAQVISHARREIVQSEKLARTTALDTELLLGAIQGDSVSPEGIDPGLALSSERRRTRSGQSRLTAAHLLGQLR
jgi:hypothetical protein